MGLGQRQVARQFQVHLHEPMAARDPSAQVMRTAYTGHTAGQRQHLFTDIARKSLIHQDRRAFPGDLQRAPEDVQGNPQAEESIQLWPAQARKYQGKQDTGIEQ
ncbi:hypothetical protein D3C76_1423450 [compost metagenome]